MPLTDEFEDVLKQVELAVIGHWDKYPDLNNYNVAMAYEAAITYYKAVASGQTAKPHNLRGLDASGFEKIQAACEARLNHPINDREAKSALLTPEDLVACLRRLRKSVEFWTKQSGRQGYLEHVAQFLPR
jgi:hypothetical protein